MTEDQIRARISELNDLIMSMTEHTPDVSKWTAERNALMDDLARLHEPAGDAPVDAVAMRQAAREAGISPPPPLAYATPTPTGVQINGIPIEAFVEGTLLRVTRNGLVYHGRV